MARRGWRARQYRDGKMMLAEHLEPAQQKVVQLFKNEVAMFIKADFKHQQVLDWCLKQEHQHILRQARGIATDVASPREIMVVPNRVNVKIHFPRTHYCTPEIHVLQRFAPDTAINKLALTLSDLRDKWVRVAALVSWFDKNATAGAVRNLWPTLCALAPEHPGLQEANVGTYYVDPPGYSLWLPTIRETATTVSAALMLPKPEDTASKVIEFFLPVLTQTINGQHTTWGGHVIPVCD